VLQISGFKLTKNFSSDRQGRRIFLRAPLHHHYQFKWKDRFPNMQALNSKLVWRFHLVSILALIAGLLVFFKLRIPPAALRGGRIPGAAERPSTAPLRPTRPPVPRRRGPLPPPVTSFLRGHPMTYESALDVLTRHGQTHLLRFWNELDAAARETLLAEIAAIDFEDRKSVV